MGIAPDVLLFALEVVDVGVALCVAVVSDALVCRTCGPPGSDSNVGLDAVADVVDVVVVVTLQFFDATPATADSELAGIVADDDVFDADTIGAADGCGTDALAPVTPPLILREYILSAARGIVSTVVVERATDDDAIDCTVPAIELRWPNGGAC